MYQTTISRPNGEPASVELEDWLLLPAIGLLPWAFGGVEMWAFRVAAFLIVGAVCVVLWKSGPRSLGIGQAGERWQLAAFLLAVWAAVQLLPLPAPVIRLVSPHAHRIYSETLPGYPQNSPRRTLASLEHRALERAGAPLPGSERAEERRDVDCGGTWRTISLHPSATAESLCWYVALLGAFLVARGRAARPKTARVYRWVLFVNFAALAVFGLIQSHQWNGRIYWARPVLVDGHPFGPYVNATHFAGVMELAVPWMAGYTWSRLSRAKRRWLDYPLRFLLAAAGTVVCLAAGLATASKAAAVVLPVGLFVLALLGARTARFRLKLCLVAALLASVLAVTLAGTAVGDRIRSHLDRLEGWDVAGGRLAGWAAASSMLNDYPLTGVGFGAFAEVYPRYLPPGEYKGWSRLHNDYIEVLIDGGIVAGILIAALVWGYGSRVGARLLREEPQVSRNRLGLVIGLTALALHASVDFHHQIPANALLFVVLAALALPLRHGPAALTGTAKGSQRRWILPFATVLLVVYADRASTGFVSGVAFARAAILIDHGAEGKAGPLLDIAARGGNRLWATREMAETRVERWDEQVAREGYEVTGAEALDRSARDYVECACLSPAGWRPFEGLARVYHRLELVRRDAEAIEGAGPGSLGYPGWVAIGMQRMAIDHAPNWHLPYDRLALMLRDYGLEQQSLEMVRQSASLLPLFPRQPYRYEVNPPPAFLDAFAEGAWHGIFESKQLDRAPYRISLAKLELQRGAHERAIRILESVFYRKYDAVERAEVELLLGEAHLSLGHHEQSRKHLEIAVKHPVLEPPALALLARLARTTGRAEEELAILSQLRWLRPDDLDLCLEVAVAALRLERWSTAEASIRRAKLLDPSDSRPHLALVESYIGQGELQLARSELKSLESRIGRTDAVVQLRSRIEAQGRGR